MGCKVCGEHRQLHAHHVLRASSERRSGQDDSEATHGRAGELCEVRALAFSCSLGAAESATPACKNFAKI